MTKAQVEEVYNIVTCLGKITVFNVTHLCTMYFKKTMPGKLTIWICSVKPTPGKAALVKLYSMNGLINKSKLKSRVKPTHYYMPIVTKAKQS
jgi:hypothetical protein